MYEIAFSQSARKALKRLSKSVTFPQPKLVKLFDLLKEGVSLPAFYKDHQLKGDMSAIRECHLGFDILVTYRRNEEIKVVTIMNVGTHDDLFG